MTNAQWMPSVDGQDRITVLIDNRAARDDLATEHGLSFAVEVDGHLGLFDTGQSDLLVHNAAILGVDLSRVEWIVLSHGHYDHGGGLPALLKIAPTACVHAHPSALEPRWVREADGSWRYAGLPLSRQELEQHTGGLRLSTDPVQVQAGVWTSGEIPRTTSFEGIPARFWAGPANSRHPDGIMDDQALILPGEGGTLLLGCCHAGVVNTLRHVEHLHGEMTAVVGGMHLRDATEERRQRSFEALTTRRLVVPLHCSGERAQSWAAPRWGSAGSRAVWSRSRPEA